MLITGFIFSDEIITLKTQLNDKMIENVGLKTEIKQLKAQMKQEIQKQEQLKLKEIIKSERLTKEIDNLTYP